MQRRPETNWAGNHTYRARRIVRPSSVEELQELVATEPRVRALGSRHSFTAITDTDGVLVETAALPRELVIDEESRTVSVGGGARYGEVAGALHRRGWALRNLASLPHISIAGAVATGTHGSGDGNAGLAAAVRALEYVDPAGELRRLLRGDADFDGSVVALGCLGVVVRLQLEIEPTFQLRQDVYTGLPWDAFLADPSAVTSAAYSVSLFTRWTGDTIDQVWLKSTTGEAPPDELLGARPAPSTVHMLRGGVVDAVTEQQGVLGPWHERLPHFRMEFTPSHGEELQSEYLLPRDQLVTAVHLLRRIGPRLDPVLQVSEIRTVAADRLWLSGAYGADVAGVHFTWHRDPAAVHALLPEIEAALLPLGARPHWGKCFAVAGERLGAAYPRTSDFLALRDRIDPDRKFLNEFVAMSFGLGPS